MRKSKTIVGGITIKWKGIFDLDELYKNMKYWLDYNSFGDHENNFQEKKYVERVKGDAKQIEIKWIAQRNLGDYFAYVINIKFFIIGLKDIEVEVGGRKQKTKHGEVKIKISSELILDRQNTWNVKLFQDMYERFIVNNNIEEHKTGCYGMTYTLHDEIKDYLTMHRH
jgi:hypothetical protein